MYFHALSNWNVFIHALFIINVIQASWIYDANYSSIMPAFCLDSQFFRFLIESKVYWWPSVSFTSFHVHLCSVYLKFWTQTPPGSCILLSYVNSSHTLCDVHQACSRYTWCPPAAAPLPKFNRNMLGSCDKGRGLFWRYFDIVPCLNQTTIQAEFSQLIAYSSPVPHR